MASILKASANYNQISILMRHLQFLSIAFLMAVVTAGCASTNATMLGGAPDGLEPVPAEEVTVYSDTSTVDCEFDRVAALQTSGTVQGMDEKMVESAKEKAGEVGANAIILKRMNSEGASFGDRYGNTEGRYLAIYEERPCE